jgi:hypothetical protein
MIRVKASSARYRDPQELLVCTLFPLIFALGVLAFKKISRKATEIMTKGGTDRRNTLWSIKRSTCIPFQNSIFLINFCQCEQLIMEQAKSLNYIR